MAHIFLRPGHHDKATMELDINNISENNDVYKDDPAHISQIINNLNTGVWEYNANTKETRWSASFYRILGYEPGEIPCSYDFFFEQLIHQDDRDTLSKMENTPLHVRLLTKSAGYQWYEVITKNYADGPLHLSYGLLINIHQYKLGLIIAEQSQKSITFLESHNKRLQNFAYIVSHNLRSYAGNLKFMVNLYRQNDLQHERESIFSHIQSISKSFAAAVEHLDEIVNTQLEYSKEKKPVNLESLFTNITDLLGYDIIKCNAQIDFDFSKCPEVDYIPAFMESIFQNLLTNALKYCDANRPLVVKCYSYKIDGHIYLIFEDNGIGIDLERYGDEIFGLYKTFHRNDDARGIGLYITRNQVESLGGSIKIESAVNMGTKFTIKLA